MTKKTFIIKYTAKATSGQIIASGKMRAKNKTTSLQAQIHFENYLKKKYLNFGQLIVHECYEENDFMSMFKDIFNQRNY